MSINDCVDNVYEDVNFNMHQYVKIECNLPMPVYKRDYQANLEYIYNCCDLEACAIPIVSY